MEPESLIDGEEKKSEPKLKVGQYLRVTWEDIFDSEVPLEIFNNPEQIKKEITPMIAHTYGELLAISDKRIVVGMCVGRQDGDNDASIEVIPIGVISKIEILTVSGVVGAVFDDGT